LIFIEQRKQLTAKLSLQKNKRK